MVLISTEDSIYAELEFAYRFVIINKSDFLRLKFSVTLVSVVLGRCGIFTFSVALISTEDSIYAIPFTW